MSLTFFMSSPAVQLRGIHSLAEQQHQQHQQQQQKNRNEEAIFVHRTMSSIRKIYFMTHGL